MTAVTTEAKQRRKNFQEQALNRVGETRVNSLGSIMIIDEYNNSQDIWVRFPKGNLVNTTYHCFIRGIVKDVNAPSIFGVGFIGEGKYKAVENGVSTEQYKVWHSMLVRCYSEKFKEKQPTYRDCTCAEEWLNFQNFAAWYDKNYYEIEGYKTSHLDKDILVKGNKVYGPDTCVFVPRFINSLFIKRDKLRGNLPIGVRASSKKFEALCNNNKGERIYIGVYKTPEEAFEAYKVVKERIIKEVAEQYRDRLPAKLYTALHNYTVEIND